MTKQAYLLFDERMLMHRPINLPDESMEDQQHPRFVCERPSRAKAVRVALQCLNQQIKLQHGQRPFLRLPCTHAKPSTVCLAHSWEHYKRMQETAFMTDRQLLQMDVENDLYFCKDTFQAATLAVGGCVNAVDAVCSDHAQSKRAIAVVRPPGHHATHDSAMGTLSK